MDSYQDFVYAEVPEDDDFESDDWNGEEDWEEDWEEGEGNPEDDNESEEPSLESLRGIYHEMKSNGYQQQRDDVINMIELKGGEYTVNAAIEMHYANKISFEAFKFVLDLAVDYDDSVDAEVVERIEDYHSVMYNKNSYM